jgi:hypothetical protein
MRAIVVSPGIPNSARLDEAPDPPASVGRVLVLGHESLGVVEDAPAQSGLARDIKVVIEFTR